MKRNANKRSVADPASTRFQFYVIKAHEEALAEQCFAHNYSSSEGALHFSCTSNVAF